MAWFRKQENHRRRRFVDRLFRRVVFKLYARDLLIDLQLEAKRESVTYIKQRMQHCRIFPTRFDLLQGALKAAPPAGLVLEFGVYRGESIRALAKWSPGQVHGFDSFEGLPEDWSGTGEGRGKFDLKGRLPRLPDKVTLHPGWFDQSIPAFLAQHAELLSFVHIDCDIYASTKTVLALIGPRLQAGSILVFDEYFNYPNWQAHEFKAFQEFVGAHGVAYEYVGFTARGGTVTVKITDPGSAAKAGA